jgi:hypothetical protein
MGQETGLIAAEPRQSVEGGLSSTVVAMDFGLEADR